MGSAPPHASPLNDVQTPFSGPHGGTAFNLAIAFSSSPCDMFFLCSILSPCRITTRNMSVAIQIEAINGHQLRLTGDVETLLDLPARAKAEGFSLAISDGSLIRGGYDAGSDCCQFSISVEGAAIIKITREDGGDRLDIGWRIDWITLACGSDTLCPIDADDARDARQMALDIDVRQAA